MLLMEASDNAIVKTVAEALGLSEGAVSIESEHIVSNVTNVATVLVELRILAPARRGFSSYELCYQNYTEKFVSAINTNKIHERLLTIAEDIGAYELYQITAVNIDALTNEGVVDTSVSDKDGDDLTAGYFAGVVIGVIVAFLALFALVYLCISAINTAGENKTKVGYAVPNIGTPGPRQAEDTQV